MELNADPNSVGLGTVGVEESDGGRHLKVQSDACGAETNDEVMDSPFGKCLSPHLENRLGTTEFNNHSSVRYGAIETDKLIRYLEVPE